MCDEDNFNCFNEVNLKRLNNEHDIIDDLLNICNTLSNDNINQLKPIVQNSKSNGKIKQYNGLFLCMLNPVQIP
jgi:hypothetical protein